MCPRVLPCDIRQALLVDKACSLEHQEGPGRVLASSELLAADHQAKLKWHIKTRQLIDGIQLDNGNIMNAVRRFFNESEDLIEAHVAAIAGFQCRPGSKTTSQDGENH